MNANDLRISLVDFFEIEIKPFIRQDGGDIELIDVKDNIIYVEFKGACLGCPFSLYTLILGVQAKVQEKFPSIKKVVLQ